MKRLLKFFLICWLVFSVIYITFDLFVGFDKEVSENTQIFKNALELIQKYYIDEVKLREIVYPAIKEMVGQLDPHSYFLTPEENKKVKEGRKDVQEYAGIGAIVGFRQDWQVIRNQIEVNNFDINQASIEIKKPFDNSPAQKAGLMPRDEIVAIDGILIKDIGVAEVAKVSHAEMKMGMKLKEVVGKILGPAGTRIKLTIKREGWTKPKDFDIFRQKIQIKNVEWKIIFTDNKKIGYLQIRGFGAQSTAKEVRMAIKSFRESRVGAMIIDLRDNPGGLLNTCNKVLENFLPPDTLIISAKGRKDEDRYFTDSSYGEYIFDYLYCSSLPLVVLVNEGSASASEIVAGVLYDYKKAILIGEKTFGKSSVQRVWEFPDGSALALTIKKYFLPNGEFIHGKGILPHIEIETSFDEPVISAALKVLLNWELYKEKFLK